MNPAVRLLLNPNQLKQLAIWKLRLLSSDVEKGLTEQARIMCLPIRICRKDDHGKVLVVTTVDGAIVNYLKQIKESADTLGSGGGSGGGGGDGGDGDGGLWWW